MKNCQKAFLLCFFLVGSSCGTKDHTIISDLEYRIEQLNDHLVDIENRVSDLEYELYEEKGKISDLEYKIYSLEADISSLEYEILFWNW